MTGPAEKAAGDSAGQSAFERLRSLLRDLYFGVDRRAAIFQYCMLAFDVGTILLFVVITFVHEQPWVVAACYIIFVPLTLDYLARMFISANPLRFLVRPASVADLVIIITLLIPVLIGDLAFLRVLNALRLIRSYHVLGLLRRRYPGIRRREDVLTSATNLFLFVFIVSAIVYVSQRHINADIADYTDALYFTVTTLTTTGFGDVTLVGESGRMLAVIIMIAGISLFIHLAQTLFRPSKVRAECPNCGLMRHDPDAVHCKHCGRVIHIPNEGD